MAPPLTLPHLAWRMLPAGLRRAAFTRLSAGLAPRPARIPPPAQSGLAICGELHRASGLGEGARLMSAAAQQLGLPVWEIAAGDLIGPKSRQAAEIPPAGVPLALHINAPSLPAALLRLPRNLLRARRVIGYWAWELPKTPANWKAGAQFVHEIWAPSHFTAAALEGLAPGRVRVVPHPVAVSPPRPSGLTRADFDLPEDAFVVLTSFSLASSLARKNPLAAIAAFRSAFGNRADHVMVLKLSHTEHWADDLSALRQAVADVPNIHIIAATMPQADSHALTACADVVLSLHRSEGFGLVPAEAMLLGKPVIATDWSATAEFIDATNGMPVPYRLIEAADPRGVFVAPGAVWADAAIDAASDALRALANDPVRRRLLGQEARRRAQRQFTAEPLRDALVAIGLDAASLTATGQTTIVLGTAP